MMIMIRQPALLFYLCLLVYCVWCEPSSQQQDDSTKTMIVSTTAIFNTFMTTAQKKNNELPIIPNPRMDKSTEKSHPQHKTAEKRQEAIFSNEASKSKNASSSSSSSAIVSIAVLALLLTLLAVVIIRRQRMNSRALTYIKSTNTGLQQGNNTNHSSASAAEAQPVRQSVEEPSDSEDQAADTRHVEIAV